MTVQAPASAAQSITKPKAAFLRVVTALILREMSTRYGRTPGGYVWALVEPLAAIGVLSIGFSLVLRSPSLGNSFLLFFASGYMTFQFYLTLSNVVGRAIWFSKPLLRYPAVTWLDAVVARAALNFLTSFLVALILMIGVIVAIGYRAPIDPAKVIEAFALAAFLGVGVGLVNCVLMGLYPIWEVIWSVLTRPLFLASAIFYIYEDLPGLAQDILYFNPLVHLTGLARSGIYPGYHPEYVQVWFPLLLSLFLTMLGLILLRRYYREILQR